MTPNTPVTPKKNIQSTNKIEHALESFIFK